MKSKELIRKLAKIIIPNRLYDEIIRLRLKSHCRRKILWDLKRYFRYSYSTAAARDRGRAAMLETEMILAFHVIEKGLSFRAPRLFFGNIKIKELEHLVDEYEAYDFPPVNSVYRSSVGVLRAYLQYHEPISKQVMDGNYVNFFKELQRCVIRHEERISGTKYGGVECKTRQEILRHCNSNFSAFSRNRFSIRQFSPEPVNPDTIRDAIRVAQKAPSACNRQSARVYVISDPEVIERIALLQRGMLGFEKEIKTLLLIAADITCFGGAEEIHQMFVDGSLFAMSLIYALHERGLATCPLHAGFNKVSERALRRMVSLPEFHCPILFIAIGHYEDVFKVTCSGRKEVDEILIYCRQNGG